MLPFRVEIKTGLPVYEQVVYAVKKAIVSGQLLPGETFPSVRTLSQELKMNPNTAHKVVMTLVSEGLLEVKPGIGTVVAQALTATRGQRSLILNEEVERLGGGSQEPFVGFEGGTGSREETLERIAEGVTGRADFRWFALGSRSSLGGILIGAATKLVCGVNFKETGSQSPLGRG